MDRNGNVTGTLDRSNTWAVQTPQAFKADLIKRAYAALASKGKTEVTDDAAAVALLPDAPPARLVEWTRPNIKITTVEDLATIATLLHAQG